jgi:hypothetical protein
LSCSCFAEFCGCIGHYNDCHSGFRDVCVGEASEDGDSKNGRILFHSGEEWWELIEWWTVRALYRQWKEHGATLERCDWSDLSANPASEQADEQGESLRAIDTWPVMRSEHERGETKDGFR